MVQIASLSQWQQVFKEYIVSLHLCSQTMVPLQGNEIVDIKSVPYLVTFRVVSSDVM